jgi:hypothetical protein
MKIFLKYTLTLSLIIFPLSILNAQNSSLTGSPPIAKVTTQTVEKQDSKGIIDDLLIPISKMVTLLSVSIGIIISIRQFRLKVKEEIRLSKSAQSENDVKLLALFAETIDIANGRKSHIISEKVIESLFTKDIIGQNDFSDIANLENVKKKLEVATRVIPVGAASQSSAIAAIGVLGKKYEVLREPALKGLNNLISQGIIVPTQEVLDDLNRDIPKLGCWSKIKNWW